MTDPRMTPTNDAPVTVDVLQPWRAAWSTAVEPFASTVSEDAGVGPMLPTGWPTVGDLRRLAALASAPAECTLCGTGPHDPDPRMTPTNDAPEQAMGRIMRYVAMREAMPMRQSGDVIHAIHTGTEWEAELRLSDLAALASAPAGDGEYRVNPDRSGLERMTMMDDEMGLHDESVPAGDSPCEHESWTVNSAGQRIACVDCGHGFSDARKPIAPAADGVEAATRMLRDCADHLVSTASHHGQYAAIDQDKIDGLRDAVRDYDAALARPRAAVGEQTIPLYTFEEAWDELVNVSDRTSPEEYPHMCLITRDELRTFMEARQYAPALQSPPAKVEGNIK